MAFIKALAEAHGMTTEWAEEWAIYKPDGFKRTRTFWEGACFRNRRGFDVIHGRVMPAKRAE